METEISAGRLAAIPRHMRQAVKLYYEKGVPGGSFLTSVLANDFVAAATRADPVNKEALAEWAGFVGRLPPSCWGSYKRVSQWCSVGGTLGVKATLQQNGATQIGIGEYIQSLEIAGHGGVDDERPNVTEEYAAF